MTKSGLLLATALALAITAASAADDPNSADYIMPYCRSSTKDQPSFAQGFCRGVVKGIIFTGHQVKPVQEIVHLKTRTRISFEEGFLRSMLCIDAPDEVMVNQAVGVVVAYIDARPARMHENFALLALEALREAWPCK